MEFEELVGKLKEKFGKIKFRDENGKVRLWVMGAVWGGLSYFVAYVPYFGESAGMGVNILLFPFWIMFELAGILYSKGLLLFLMNEFIIVFSLIFYVVFPTLIGASIGYTIEHVLKLINNYWKGAS